MSSDRPSIPTELLAGARVGACAEQTAERPWQNEGQATVTTVRVQLSDTRTLALIRKRGSVPKKVDGSRRTAENKLFSFSAESQFLRLLGHKLQPTVPVAWSLLHDAVDRSFDLLMSDLSAQGFSRRPEALDFEDASASAPSFNPDEFEELLQQVGVQVAGAHTVFGQRDAPLREDLRSRTCPRLRALQIAAQFLHALQALVD